MKYVTYVAFSMVFLVAASTMINANSCYEDCTNKHLAGSKGDLGGTTTCRDHNDEGELIATWPCPVQRVVYLEDGGCVPTGDIAEEGFMCKDTIIRGALRNVTCGGTKDVCVEAPAGPIGINTSIRVPCP